MSTDKPDMTITGDLDHDTESPMCGVTGDLNYL